MIHDMHHGNMKNLDFFLLVEFPEKMSHMLI